MIAQLSGSMAYNNSNAKAWERGLDDLAKSTDENLSRLRGFSSTDPAPVLPSNTNRPQQSQKETKSRPVSAPRATQRMPSQVRSGSKVSLGAANQHSNIDDGEDRKLDAVLRKMRTMEDNVRRLQKDQSVLLDRKNASDVMIDQLSEAAKHDRQTIFNLREQVGTLSNTVNALSHASNIQQKRNTEQSGGSGGKVTQAIDMEEIKEVVFRRVQAEFQPVVGEVVRTCASEQAAFLSKWSTQQEINLQNRGDPISVVRSLESENRSMKNDIIILRYNTTSCA